MISYRITKYNPSKRNSDSGYVDQSEWTSISDIGNPKYGNPTYQEYKSIEDAYIKAIVLALEDNNLAQLTIKGLENYRQEADFVEYAKSGYLKDVDIDYKNDIESLSNEMKLNTIQIQKISRLILREIIWMRLESDELNIKFGYDYYMYFNCKPLSVDVIREIESNGLFVEANMGQRTFIILDEDGNEV